ncbi:GlcNAc-PI de-N-acetylase [Filimonas lacunae]|uniref:GlcNAc-PI de-N-acetylase n=1 Tax=Filimonas lacunae TaxID=477680 RepID=A0A173MD08_9BACT|nr:PIG-L family deacetylase [Filimonas lacunae]BAV05445.1 hypothetical protein FLA_1452 [Filimonas lacunae]SIT21096.1 GlcNAc-PI de-N-acetylase [Filimonas lacunae]
MKNVARVAVIAVCLFIVCRLPYAAAQYSRYKSTDIYASLQDIKTAGSVLLVGATPADRNAALLAYLRQHKHLRTGFLSVTRGEGIKNRVSTEQGQELGLVHALEAIAAASMDKTEIFFTSAVDFGWVESEGEVIKGWDMPKLTKEVVGMIRQFKPDIIITSFSVNDVDKPDARSRVLGKLMQDAFAQAADTSKYAEQFDLGVKPWQVKRMLCTTADSTHAIAFNPEQYSAISGLSITDVARYSNGQQRSIGGNDSLLNVPVQYLRVIAGDNNCADMMDGIDVSLARISSYATGNVIPLLDSMVQHFNFISPEVAVEPLLRLYSRFKVMRADTAGWKGRKLQEVQQALFTMLGIKAVITSSERYAVTGRQLPLRFAIRKNSPYPVSLSRIRCQAIDSAIDIELPQYTTRSFTAEIKVPVYTEAYQPYWLKKPMSSEYYMYTNDDWLMKGRPDNMPAFPGQFVLRIGEEEFSINLQVEYSRDSGQLSMQYQERLPELVRTILPLTVSLKPDNILIHVKPGNEYTKNPSAIVYFKSYFTQKQVKTTIKLGRLGYGVSVDGAKATGQKGNLLFEKDTLMDFVAGEVRQVNIPVQGEVFTKGEKVNRMLGASIVLELDSVKNNYNSLLRTIRYGYIPETGYYLREMCRLIPDEINTRGNRIGFVSSKEDRIVYALQQMGFTVKVLEDTDFTMDTLRQLDAIVIGSQLDAPEAYLGRSYDSLLLYVQEGGNCIVQGQDVAVQLTRPFLLTSAPFRINNKDGKVSVQPEVLPTMQAPNSITAEEWSSFGQDVCRFAAVSYDPAFVSCITLSRNPENKSTRGSLLRAVYGRGNFIYSSLNLSSQLAEGRAMAYKLLANLIAWPGN